MKISDQNKNGHLQTEIATLKDKLYESEIDCKNYKDLKIMADVKVS